MKSRALYKAINPNGAFWLSNCYPTYWPTDPAKIPDCIDFFVNKGINDTFTEIENVNDLSSNHFPIILTLSNGIIRKPPRPKLTSKNTDWDNF